MIVVDNASADGSPDMVRARYPQARLIVSAENRGYSAANNQGAAVAQGDYLLYLNSDTVVAADALVKPLAYLQAHPEVGALTVRLVYPSGERDPDNHRGFPTPWNAFQRVTLPLLWPGIIAGFMLAFVISLDDVVITEFVKSGGQETLPTYMLGQLRRIVTPEINAIATVFLLISVAFVTTFFIINRRKP